MRVLKKIGVACISGMILSFMLAVLGHDSGSSWVEGSYYPSLLDLFFVYAIFCVPVYMLGGVPFSLAADMFIRKVKRNRWLRYAAALGVYIFGGWLVMMLFLVVFLREPVFNGADSDKYFFYYIGIAASLLFLHIELLLKAVRGRRGKHG